MHLAQALTFFFTADGGETLPVNYALTLPERLPKNHLLLELDDNERGAGDLSGDTGVIGRFVQEPGTMQARDLSSSFGLSLSCFSFQHNFLPSATDGGA